MMKIQFDTFLKKLSLGLALGCMTVLSFVAQAEVTSSDITALRKEVAALRVRIEGRREAPLASKRIQDILHQSFKSNEEATTRQGRLTIGGLLQVWYYSIQNDNRSWVDADQVSGGPSAGFGSNETADNDSFRVRRTELHFTMDIHENVQAFVIINPSNEPSSFPSFPTNQAQAGPAFINAGFDGATPIGHVRNDAVRTGSGSPNGMLQEAFINYHGIIPHHDFTIGQFKPRLGEEGVRSSGRLDFAERSMIGQLADNFDMGMQVHGTWIDERLQYWFGIFNGTGTAFQGRANRSDDNDEMDLVGAIMGRPLWKDDTWGSMELGYSIRYGRGGESGSRFSGTQPVDGLNRKATVHVQQHAWALYKPGGPVRGWWLRGEWMNYRDRFAPGQVITGNAVQTLNPGPFNIQGWYVSSGYKISESRWADSFDGAARLIVRPLEFTFRYESVENLFHHDLLSPTRKLDVYKTQIFTAGLNYYIKGHNAKIQANYNWVIEEDNRDDQAGRQLREVNNNNFVVNFQVAW